MKIDVTASLEATETALVWLTPENLVAVFSDPWSRPQLECVSELNRVSNPDGYVKFYLRATVKDKSDETEIIRMSLHEVCDFFQQKVRATKGLENFYVNSVAVLSPKADRMT